MRKLKGSTSPYDRVMAKTRREGACLIYTGSLMAAGYGQVTEFVDGRRFNRYAHRVVFEHHNPGVASQIVRHSCDVRSCVEPAHLLAGTYSDNNDDMYTRNRRRRGDDGSRTECAHGHDLTGENGVWRKPRTERHRPYLDCRICTRDRSVRRRNGATA